MPLTQARRVDVSVLQVARAHAIHKERDPQVSGCVWRGDQETGELQMALRSVARFDTQALRWKTPRVRTPEHYERWSQVVAMVYHHQMRKEKATRE